MATILKIGGSVITDKERDGVIFYDVLERLLSELHDYRNQHTDDDIYMIHGGGSFGHRAVELMENQLMTAEDVHKEVCKLNEAVVEYARKVGLGIENHAPYDNCTFVKSEHQYNIDHLWDKLKAATEEKKAALTFGDMIPDDSGGHHVISGDMMAVLFAEKLLSPDKPRPRIIMVTNVGGVYDKNPDLYEDAKLIREIRNGEKVDAEYENSVTDVTRGMKGKVGLLRNRAAKQGVTSHIINGKNAGALKRALDNDYSFGTLILPNGGH
jgi:isopentenyl phosphate kinase